MNFRRQPFQFSTIDPVKRQAELQKRFGLPTTNSDMFVDFLNPGMMGSGIREPSSLGGSPRLQHRVPVFHEKVKGDSEQNNVDSSHKPRVRVIPIQVEGVDGGKRQRNFSGPANIRDRNGENCQEKLPDTFPPLNSFKVDEKLKAPSQPKVCNIPIQIEPRDVKSGVDSSLPAAAPRDVKSGVDSSPPAAAPRDVKSGVDSRLPSVEPVTKLKAKMNGCAASSAKKKELGIRSLPLKQIEDVLNKLKLYTGEVEKFSGTSKDKQYRYLDEMLTRCMLDLDNVETMGLEDIRKARKEAVRQVQHYVDLLDTKVNELVEKMDSSSVNVEQMMCDIPAKANSTVKPDLNSNESEELSNNCASSDALSEVNSASSQDNSDDTTKISITGDVEMSDDKLEYDTTSDKLSEDKSGIVIEELDDDLESNTVDMNETVSCVISDCPKLDVKDTIIEEGDSEIVIEEVEDSDIKDFALSSNVCDIIIDTDNKSSVEQVSSDISEATNNLSNCATMSQNDKAVTENL